jgi:hypothetical protein
MFFMPIMSLKLAIKLQLEREGIGGLKKELFNWLVNGDAQNQPNFLLLFLSRRQ